GPDPWGFLRVIYKKRADPAALDRGAVTIEISLSRSGFSRSVFVLAAELPLQAVDNAFDARLENIGGDADRAPALLIVGEDRQHAHQRGGALLVFLLLRSAVQQAHVELLEADLGKLRVVLLENLPHRVIHRVHGAAAARRDQFFVAEDLDRHRRFGDAAQRLRRGEIDLIVDLAAQHLERLEVIFALADRHQLERSPRAVQAKKFFLQFFAHLHPLVRSEPSLRRGAIIAAGGKFASARPVLQYDSGHKYLFTPRQLCYHFQRIDGKSGRRQQAAELLSQGGSAELLAAGHLRRDGGRLRRRRFDRIRPQRRALQVSRPRRPQGRQRGGNAGAPACRRRRERRAERTLAAQIRGRLRALHERDFSQACGGHRLSRLLHPGGEPLLLDGFRARPVALPHRLFSLSGAVQEVRILLRRPRLHAQGVFRAGAGRRSIFRLFAPGRRLDQNQSHGKLVCAAPRKPAFALPPVLPSDRETSTHEPSGRSPGHRALGRAVLLLYFPCPAAGAAAAGRSAGRAGRLAGHRGAQAERAKDRLQRFFVFALGAAKRR